MTTRYFRLQPAGLGLDHVSECSDDSPAGGLFVFENASECAHPDCHPSAYGDEVVVIEAEDAAFVGDVEGVVIDGSRARIVARVPFEVFRETWEDYDE